LFLTSYYGRKADVSRRGRWEAAYMELLLGANQKLAGEEPSFLGVVFSIKPSCSCEDIFPLPLSFGSIS
jgi:hypothetical protein